MTDETIKSIDTLCDDIYATIGEGSIPDPELVDRFARTLAETVVQRLSPRDDSGKSYLRMSNLGRGDRQLWYSINGDFPPEELADHTRLKFLLGDVWEAVLLFLAEASGHKVERQQETVELEGIKGHIDAVIDGVLVDVKSASTYSFKKFNDGTLRDNDPFGYYDQISGYATATGVPTAAFLAGDKQNGHITLLKVSEEEIESVNSRERIKWIKSVLESPEEPERCHEDVEHGAGGNRALGTNCSYCPFKHHCWRDANNGVGLRTFLYASGPVFMTHVEKEPKVFESFPTKE